MNLPEWFEEKRKDSVALLYQLCSEHKIPFFSEERDVLTEYQQYREIASIYSTSTVVYISNFVIKVITAYLEELKNPKSNLQYKEIVSYCSPKIDNIQDIKGILTQLRKQSQVLNDNGSISLTEIEEHESISSTSITNVRAYCSSLLGKIIDIHKRYRDTN